MHIFLQGIPVPLASLDESTPMKHLASVVDRIADLLSTQASAVSTIQSPDHNVFIEGRATKTGIPPEQNGGRPSAFVFQLQSWA